MKHTHDQADDAIIEAAIEERAIKRLHSSDRGRVVANQLHELFTGPATGLDSLNNNAVVILAVAFCHAGRRNFVEALKTEVA